MHFRGVSLVSLVWICGVRSARVVRIWDCSNMVVNVYWVVVESYTRSIYACGHTIYLSSWCSVNVRFSGRDDIVLS